MGRTDDTASAAEMLARRVDALEAACERLACENVQLRASVGARTSERLAGADEDVDRRGQRPISRAGLLKAAAAGAVGTVLASELVAPAAALADGTEGPTTFSTSSLVAVLVECTAPGGTGIDVVGPGS